MANEHYMQYCPPRPMLYYKNNEIGCCVHMETVGKLSCKFIQNCNNKQDDILLPTGLHIYFTELFREAHSLEGTSSQQHNYVMIVQ